MTIYHRHNWTNIGWTSDHRCLIQLCSYNDPCHAVRIAESAIIYFPASESVLKDLRHSMIYWSKSYGIEPSEGENYVESLGA